MQLLVEISPPCSLWRLNGDLREVLAAGAAKSTIDSARCSTVGQVVAGVRARLVVRKHVSCVECLFDGNGSPETWQEEQRSMGLARHIT